MTKTVIEIVREHLVAGGFDGLVRPDVECGCLLADLAPCCDDISACRPGYRVKDTTFSDGWALSVNKPE